MDRTADPAPRIAADPRVGVRPRSQGNWDWDEPFVAYGLFAWAAVSAVAFGYLGHALGRAGEELATEGPSPPLALQIRNLVWLSRALLVVLLAIVFMMTVKLGTRPSEPASRAARQPLGLTMCSEAAMDYVSGIGADGSVCQRPNSLPSGSCRSRTSPCSGLACLQPPRRRARARARDARVDVVDVEVRPRAALAGLRVRDGRALLLAEPRHVVLDGPG